MCLGWVGPTWKEAARSRSCLGAAAVPSSPGSSAELSCALQTLSNAGAAQGQLCYLCLFSSAATCTLNFHTPGSLASLVSICCSSAEMFSCCVPFLFSCCILFLLFTWPTKLINVLHLVSDQSQLKLSLLLALVLM